MDTTANLKLPYIMAAQSQKHVTHNEAIRALDAIVQLAVISRTMESPPAGPAEGDRYIAGPDATGAWSGHSSHVAAFQDGAWVFHVPRPGWLAWVASDGLLYGFDGTAWLSAAGNATVNPVAFVGVNATADTTNRLAVKASATLLDNDGAGHQLKLNKAVPADTASLLYQTGYSGRAEVGLAGDDNLHIKVSADGAAWRDAIVIDRFSGEVSLPQTPAPAPVNADWNATSGAALILNKPAIPAAYALPVATPSILGGVKQGGNITIAGDGTISAAGAGVTPAAKSAIPATAAAAGSLLYVADAPSGPSLVCSDGTAWRIAAVLGSVISATNAETDALLARMAVAPSAARKNAIDALIGALKSSGVWPKLDVLQIYAAHDVQAATLNWLGASYTATPVANPTWIANRHFAGNGSTSYINTGFNPSLSALSGQNDATLGFWSNSSSAATSYILGVIGAGSLWSMMGRVSATQIYASVNHGSGAPPAITQTYAQKNLAVTRNGAAAVQIYARGAQFATDSSASGARPNGAYFAGGNDNVPSGNALYQPNTWPVSAFYYGRALTPAEHAAFDAALSVYMRAVGNWTYPVACWGDSRTLGASQTPYPVALQTKSTPDRWFVNGGVSGETSTQIRTRMIADTSYSGDWLPIIWAGYNNHNDPATVLADIAAMTAKANSQNGGRYLVLTVPGSRTADFYTGTADANNLATINTAIMSTYGNRAVDAASLLTAGDPNGVPLAAYVINATTDPVHFNTAGLNVVATAVASALASLAW